MITREFVLAGRAIFTVANGRGEHYTFKVIRAKGLNSHSVLMLCGPDNGNDYRWIGSFDEKDDAAHLFEIGEIKLLPLKVFAWAIRRIWTQDGIPAGYSIIHAGRCGRCGRLLTTPESVESGFGPDCRQKVS